MARGQPAQRPFQAGIDLFSPPILAGSRKKHVLTMTVVAPSTFLIRNLSWPMSVKEANHEPVSVCNMNEKKCELAWKSPTDSRDMKQISSR